MKDDVWGNVPAAEPGQDVGPKLRGRTQQVQHALLFLQVQILDQWTRRSLEQKSDDVILFYLKQGKLSQIHLSTRKTDYMHENRYFFHKIYNKTCEKMSKFKLSINVFLKYDSY